MRQWNRAQISGDHRKHDANNRESQRSARIEQCVKCRVVQTAHRRREEPDARACQHRPHVNRVGARERAGLINHRDDYIAKNQKGRGRRYNHERDLAQSAIQSRAQNRAHLVGHRTRRACHRRQLRRGHRISEQADRHHVEQLAVVERGDGAGREQAREHVVHVCGQIDHAAADDHRRQVVEHGSHRRGDAREVDAMLAQ